MSNKMYFTVGDLELVVHELRYDDTKVKLAEKVILTRRNVTLYNYGNLYSTRVNHSGHYGRRWGGYLTLIKEALMLGALPKTSWLKVKIYEEEKKATEKERQREAARDALNSIQYAGIKVSPNVIRALRRKVRSKK